MIKRVLTGITTSGTPHLGNYVGAIRPAISASQQLGTENFYFLADLHSLIKSQDPHKTQQSTLEIAASWLACGLNPQAVHFYRQSDIPEITQLMWLLSCIAAKGTLNRAHAYKAAVEQNQKDRLDDDAGVTMGLFLYPVLMAADILLFGAQHVPVGRDQIQHLEIARDIAQRFNHWYGGEDLVLPEASVDSNVPMLIGLDGRKMSKSYGNIIPLFAPEAELKQLINSIKTDSRLPGEPKFAPDSALTALMQAFASPEQMQVFHQDLAAGMSWAQAKQQVFELIRDELKPLRARYQEFIAQPDVLEQLLRQGAQQVRERYAIPCYQRLASKVGLRSLTQVPATPPTRSNQKIKKPMFKHYRGADQYYYFKLLSPDGDVLLQSPGYAQAQQAGAQIARLKGQTDPNVVRECATVIGDLQRVIDALQHC